MTLKRLLYRTVIRFFEKLMIGRSLSTCRSVNVSNKKLPPANQQCDIVTIAFNNSQTIERQISLIKKYIQGEYNYIVADNSSDKTVRKAIENLCIKNSVGYIGLPRNYLTTVIGGGSYSHGASLNWVYYRIIKKRQPRYFGFIDHDLFPVKSISLSQKLESHPVYGHLVSGKNYWYLWAGLCFYQFDFVKNKKMDFLPAKFQKQHLDTGGGNWHTIYSKMDVNKVLAEPQQIENLGKEENEHSWFETTMHLLGDCWLHTICGSNWIKISNQKMEEKELVISKKIERIEQKQNENRLRTE
jgi:glycosyltransferase involved in cell wall biosynthesis